MQSGSITQLAWLRSRRGANYHLLIFLLEPAKPSLCALLLSSLHFHLVASMADCKEGGLQQQLVCFKSTSTTVSRRIARSNRKGRRKMTGLFGGSFFLSFFLCLVFWNGFEKIPFSVVTAFQLGRLYCSLNFIVIII